jgi:hypothetical protein
MIITMSSQVQGSGYCIITDPDQEKAGLYKICRTANIQSTLTALNAARAAKDFRIIKFFPCSDLQKLGTFVDSALKNKFISGNKEWVKTDDIGIAKITTTLSSLCDIVNGD